MAKTMRKKKYLAGNSLNSFLNASSEENSTLVGTFYSIFKYFFFSGIKNSTVKLPGNKFQPAESEEGTAYRNVIK